MFENLPSYNDLTAQGWIWLCDLGAFEAGRRKQQLKLENFTKEYCLGKAKQPTGTNVGIYERNPGSKGAVTLPFPSSPSFCVKDTIDEPALMQGDWPVSKGDCKRDLIAA